MFFSCLIPGLNGLVQIYDTSLWGAEPQVAQPQFEHRGHMVSSPQSDVITTSHVWHPERARTLLSAASDASVHVWDWIDQSERGWQEIEESELKSVQIQLKRVEIDNSDL